jgi:hypothetical protein
VWAEDIDPNNPDDHDLMLLCIKPRVLAIRFAKAKAYGNHFRVFNHWTHLSQTFDNGVASMFQQHNFDARAIHMNYVGVLKDIVQLDYGPIHTLVILFRREWIKFKDN